MTINQCVHLYLLGTLISPQEYETLPQKPHKNDMEIVLLNKAIWCRHLTFSTQMFSTTSNIGKQQGRGVVRLDVYVYEELRVNFPF